MAHQGKRPQRPPLLPEETYVVSIQRDAETGVVVFETWEKDGMPHREDGPASISRDRMTGVIVDEAWFRYGKFHRADGPAHIQRKPDTGRVYFSAWFNEGRRLPSTSPRRGTGIKRSQAKPATPSGPTA
jgi:hypothetical protein